MGERSSLVRSKNRRDAVGYSTFDPSGSIDSGLSISPDDSTARTGGGAYVAAVEDARERVSISWENIQAFVDQPGPSFFKRLCFGTDENQTPTKKHVLVNVSGSVEAGTLLAVMGAR
ncbi:uncharacterized protein LOC110062656 [Orbicella faveolata]|uniref:uncharacterized protein LOC110062656 n=1 Tax=Orbicella faveolata TaxID=48498 RepID=UPI0009E53020|nr:uncharacterized protein LOC110062656 [Orbicella faveolata]